MRRTIISSMCMAAAIVLAASCNKIEGSAASTEGNGRTVINGVAGAIGNESKAYNAYRYDVLWQENDEIYVTQADGTNDLFVLDEGKDTSKGKFVEKGKKGIHGDIEAFYPASLKTDDGYGRPPRPTTRWLRCMPSRLYPVLVPKQSTSPVSAPCCRLCLTRLSRT